MGSGLFVCFSGPFLFLLQKTQLLTKTEIMKKTIIMILFIMMTLSLHAPVNELIPPWKPVSFEIENLKIITRHGEFTYKTLPNFFLVYERQRIFGYEIILKTFNSYIKKWH
jgi:hypothetical protein